MILHHRNISQYTSRAFSGGVTKKKFENAQGRKKKHTWGDGDTHGGEWRNAQYSRHGQTPTETIRTQCANFN